MKKLTKYQQLEHMSKKMKSGGIGIPSKQNKKVLTLILGGVCTGKTTFRNNNLEISNSFIDAGDIFLELSDGNYYDFPSHLESEMENLGLMKMKEAIINGENIVIELIGSNPKSIEEIIDLSKKIGYKSKVIHLKCDLEVAKQRNNDRSDDNISAYYCEPYHIKWFTQAALEFLM